MLQGAIKNHDFNVGLFKDNHNHITLTTQDQIVQFLNFLEWLLPYDAESSKLHHLSQSMKTLTKTGAAHFCLFGFHFHKKLGRATTFCLSSLENDSFKGYARTIQWTDFKHPLYNEADRDDSMLPTDLKELLTDLSE